MRTYHTIAFVLALLLPGLASATLTVDGINGEIGDAIKSSLSLTDACDQPRWVVRYRFETAPQEIRRVLETYGYYSPEIARNLTFGEDCFDASFTVKIGPPTIITRANVDITGEMEKFRELLANNPMGRGTRFDHEVYEGFKTEIGDIAARFGFLEGAFQNQRVVVDAQANTAEIDLIYATGPRYRFGEIQYTDGLINERLLRRYRPFEPGTPYDAEALNDLYRSLLESGYFEDIMVESLDPVGLEIPIAVQLIAGRKTKIRLGAGVSTDFGPRLSVRHTNRLLNRRGHQTTANAMVSTVEREIGGSYRMPQTAQADGWLSLYGGFRQEDTDTSRTTSTTAGIRRVVARGEGWVETLFLETNNDQFDVAGTSQSSLYIAPGVNYTHTWRDSDVARPRRAHRISLEVLGASRSVGSTIDFASFRLEGKIVRSLTPAIRLLARTRIGATQTDDFDSLPPRVRFFSGGDSRVRGFDFEELGVVDSVGNVIGGDRLMEFSTELDYAISATWGVATFIDAGSVSLSAFSNEFRRAAGVGLRWYSPVGPLRIDIAKPIDAEGGGFRLHLTLGPDI